MQSLFASLPGREWVCAGHEIHADPPVSFRYVPAAHPVHDPDPLTCLYNPTEHAEHAAPSDPSYPI
eukprot:349769-Rhodomonas_salina.2